MVLSCGMSVGQLKLNGSKNCRTVPLRIILHQGRRKCTQEMRNELKLLTLNSRRHFLRFISIFKILHNLDCPDQSRDILKFRRNMHDKDLRDKTLLEIVKVKSAIGQSMHKFAGAKD